MDISHEIVKKVIKWRIVRLEFKKAKKTIDFLPRNKKIIALRDLLTAQMDTEDLDILDDATEIAELLPRNERAFNLKGIEDKKILIAQKWKEYFEGQKEERKAELLLSKKERVKRLKSEMVRHIEHGQLDLSKRKAKLLNIKLSPRYLRKILKAQMERSDFTGAVRTSIMLPRKEMVNNLKNIITNRLKKGKRDSYFLNPEFIKEAAAKLPKKERGCLTKIINAQIKAGDLDWAKDIASLLTASEKNFYLKIL